MTAKVQIGGRTYAIVPSSSVVTRPATLGLARRHLHAIVGPHAHRLRQWLESERLLPLGPEPEDLFGYAAELLFHGTIAFVAEPESTRFVDAPRVEDLVRPTDAPAHRPPRTPTPAESPDETWVSFEVVDDHGRPADGAFRCVVAGRTEAGQLDREQHRYDPVPEGSAAQLYLEALRVPAAPAATLPSRADSPPPGVSDPPSPSTFVSFEVIDDEGESWEGTATVGDDDGATIALTSTHRVPADGESTPLRLHLRRSSAGMATLDA